MIELVEIEIIREFILGGFFVICCKQPTKNQAFRGCVPSTSLLHIVSLCFAIRLRRTTTILAAFKKSNRNWSKNDKNCKSK